MKVLKVINTNVLSCVDDRGREIVAMGRGLGFQLKPGMELKESDAEKIFRMDSQEQIAKLQDLIQRVPAGLLELCSRMVDHADKVLGRRLNQSIYLTLTDHIQFAMERCRNQEHLHNALLTEVRVFYPEEFTIGCYVVAQIQQHMGLKLPLDEAASIALHIVNAEYDRTMDATMRSAQVLQPMIKILEESGIHLNTSSLRYSELLVHLKFLAMEAFTSSTPEGNLNILPKNFLDSMPEAWNCAKKICDYLCQQSGKTISGAEAAYLSLCIQRAAEPR